MVKSKKMLIVIMVVVILMMVGNRVMAANALNLQITSPNSTTNAPSTNATDTNSTSTNSTNTAGNISAPVTNQQQSTNTQGSVYKNDNLPQTGITEDYTMIILVIICIVSAVYAFKKIREYKVK